MISFSYFLVNIKYNDVNDATSGTIPIEEAVLKIDAILNDKTNANKSNIIAEYIKPFFQIICKIHIS